MAHESQDHTVDLQPLINQPNNELIHHCSCRTHDQSNQESTQSAPDRSSYLRQARFNCLHLIFVLVSFITAISIATLYVRHILEQSIILSSQPSANPLLTHSVSLQEDNTYDRVFKQWVGACAFNNSKWTMSNQTAHFVDSSSNRDLPACQSRDTVLSSMKYGTRRPMINQTVHLSMDASENLPSVFVPHGCTVQWLSSSDICSTLRPFSHLAIIGDSMSRHFMHAFYAATSEDWRMGGLAALNSNSQLYDKCQCDGMFSESESCRVYAFDNLYHSQDLRGHGLCYDSIDEIHRPTGVNYHPHHGPHGVEPEDYRYLCNPNDPRPRFILLQGIWHYDADAERTITGLIDPIIYQINNASAGCSKPFTYKFLFISGHSQSRRLDAGYPHQARERMALTNERLRQHVENRWGYQVMEFWNLTNEAVSSDGMHHKSDVNLMKAQYVFNYMKHIAAEM